MISELELELQLYVEVGNDLWWYFLLLRYHLEKGKQRSVNNCCDEVSRKK